MTDLPACSRTAPSATAGAPPAAAAAAETPASFVAPERNSRREVSLMISPGFVLIRDDDDLLRVVVRDMKPEALGQLDHRQIVVQHDAFYVLDATPAREAEQLGDQQSRDAAALPAIRHSDPELNGVGTIRFAIARDSDELLAALVLDRRDERHAPVVVDVHQPVEQVRRQEFQRGHQAEEARALGERVDELDLAVAIVRPQRPDAQPQAIARTGLRCPARQELGRRDRVTSSGSCTPGSCAACAARSCAGRPRSRSAARRCSCSTAMPACTRSISVLSSTLTCRLMRQFR